MKIKVFLFFLYLLPFFITSIFNQPAIDDFWSANVIHDYGRMGAVKFFFQTVSARFFSNFLMGLFNTLPEGKIWIFKVWPVIIILLLIYSFKFFYTSLFQSLATADEILLASLLFVTAHIANMRTLFEGLYWMSSTICYQIAICLFVVGAGSIIRYLKTHSFLYGLLGLSCCILLPGSAESAAPVFFLMLLAILFSSIKQRYSLTFIVICIALTLTSIAFVALSKGNHARVQNDALFFNQNIMYALFYAVRAVGYYSLVWLSLPINIASLVLMLCAFQKLPLPVSYHLSFKYQPVLLVLVCYLVCIIIYLPISYYESAVPPPRLTTIVFFTAAHLALLIRWILKLTGDRFNRFFSHLSLVKNIRFLAWGVFFLAAFTSRNFVSVVRDLFQGNAYNYNLEANNQYNILKNCKNDTCYVTKYNHWPVFIQSSKTEIENKNSFIHLDKYFGKTILYKNEY